MSLYSSAAIVSNVTMKDSYRSQFRLPWSLYYQLKESATKNRRPLNAELVARLESTYPGLSVLREDTDVDEMRETVTTMSLAELMTPDEITMFAERMLAIAARKRTTKTTP
jgi:Arc-like DNA binding domain